MNRPREKTSISEAPVWLSAPRAQAWVDGWNACLAALDELAEKDTADLSNGPADFRIDPENDSVAESFKIDYDHPSFLRGV